MLQNMWTHTLLLCLTLLTGTHARTIALPPGAQVEGVTHARGTSFFASDVISGNVLLIDAKSGLVTTAIRPGPNRTSVGMYATRKHLFVAGAGPFDAGMGIPFGTGPGLAETSLNVYDIATGETVASCVVEEGALVNDVVADQRFAYYTDSGRGVIYKLSLQNIAECGFETIELPRGDFELQSPLPFGATANGVVTYKQGLIVANSMTQTIYFVDLANGNKVQRILPEGSLQGADGLEILRRKGGPMLYVAQNSLNTVSIWRLQISRRVVSAKRAGSLTLKEFGFPTTVAIAPEERLLLVPNPRFDEVIAVPGQQEVFTVSVVKL